MDTSSNAEEKNVSMRLHRIDITMNYNESYK